MNSSKEVSSGHVPSHTRIALDEIYKDSQPGVLTEGQFAALGDLAAVALLSQEFDSITELWRHVREKADRGGYSESDSARLRGMEDVLGTGVRFTPSQISVSEYASMGRAVGDWQEGKVNEDMIRLNHRGLVAIRRIGGIWSAELTPRGKQAKEMLESKPSI